MVTYSLIASLIAKILPVMLLDHRHGRSTILREPLYLDPIRQSDRDERVTHRVRLSDP